MGKVKVIVDCSCGGEEQGEDREPSVSKSALQISCRRL